MHEPLRVVMAGCGGMSEAWLRPATAMPELAIVGLMDLRVEAAQRRAAQFGLSEALTGDDLGRMLDETRPDIVFDCTVPEAHPAVTLTALAHGSWWPPPRRPASSTP
jgi:predicted dehydrogenase